MTQTYAQRKRAGAAPERAEAKAKGPSVGQLAAGAAPTTEQMGSRVDLPGEIREKMESSFGADFSNVKLYESQTVADAGAEAVTQGNNIAFAPGQLDLTSTAGQALLGHELSHVVSQARGESAGQGFLNDAHLEAQADMQGEMAARGESAYSGPVSPVGASSTAGAAGPMQAKKKKSIARDTLNNEYDTTDKLSMRRRELRDDPSLNGLEDKPWGYFAMERIAQAGDKDEEKNIANGYSGSDESVKEFLRNDMLALMDKLSASSSDLLSEDYEARANAYSESVGLNRQLSALDRNVKTSDILNEDEAAAFETAKYNFKHDRGRVRDSIRGVGSRRERKDWRQARREGKSSKEIFDERKARRNI